MFSLYRSVSIVQHIRVQSIVPLTYWSPRDVQSIVQSLLFSLYYVQSIVPLTYRSPRDEPSPCECFRSDPSTSARAPVKKEHSSAAS